jgi:hypothetical protein
MIIEIIDLEIGRNSHFAQNSTRLDLSETRKILDDGHHFDCSSEGIGGFEDEMQLEISRTDVFDQILSRFPNSTSEFEN